MRYVEDNILDINYT